MPEWLCGPSTCGGSGGWLYDFQNLIAGVFALAAGIGAYLAGLHQAKSARESAAMQIAEQQRQRKEDIDRREHETKDSHRTVVRTITFEYVSRAGELASILEDTFSGVSAALSAHDRTIEGRELAHVRIVCTRLIRESIARARAFVETGLEMLATLPVADHAQHRLTLVEIEAILLTVEKCLEEVAHTGDQAETILRYLEVELPVIIERLELSKTKIPSAENPSPHPMPEVAYLD